MLFPLDTSIPTPFDKADTRKIAKYGLDNWTDLQEYTPMEAIREQLKLASRQYNLYMKNVVALQNNLISLTTTCGNAP